MNHTVLILKFNNDISLLRKCVFNCILLFVIYLRFKLVTLDICKQRI